MDIGNVITVLAFVVIWFLLVRFILPRLGVPT